MKEREKVIFETSNKGKILIDGDAPDLGFVLDREYGKFTLAGEIGETTLSREQIYSVISLLPKITETYLLNNEERETLHVLKRLRAGVWRKLMNFEERNQLAHLKAENAALKTLLREKNQIIKEAQLENRRLRQSDGEEQKYE